MTDDIETTEQAGTGITRPGRRREKRKLFSPSLLFCERFPAHLS